MAKAKVAGKSSVKAKANGRGKPAAKTTRAPKRSAAAGKGRAAGSRRPARASGKSPGIGRGKGTIGKSGSLDGGVARRQAGDPAAVGTRPTAAHRPAPRQAKRQLPGEKAVRDTDQTFPVQPERITPGEQEPLPDAALDRRRQIVGTDDPGDTTE